MKYVTYVFRCDDLLEVLAAYFILVANRLAKKLLKSFQRAFVESRSSTVKTTHNKICITNGSLNQQETSIRCQTHTNAVQSTIRSGDTQSFVIDLPLNYVVNII